MVFYLSGRFGWSRKEIRITGLRGLFSRTALIDRNGEDKHTSFAQFAFNPDPATVVVHYLFADRQPKPGSFIDI